MMQNITLSADTNLIAQMRVYAQEHNTTVNQIIRDYFVELVNQNQDREALARQALADEFFNFCLEHPGRSEEGWKFNREECHKRGRDLG
ncbi:MAG: hypothetical protein IT426_11235 [Pirellulales bacterium]|nr:hypothetical protein [Pirellulales bacterium]